MRVGAQEIFIPTSMVGNYPTPGGGMPADAALAGRPGAAGRVRP